jgi:hypothetical protein
MGVEGGGGGGGGGGYKGTPIVQLVDLYLSLIILFLYGYKPSGTVIQMTKLQV